ncbi:pyridoxine 5'-phosphate synthase [Moraxella lincolnii]|uniref:Pyridoxine 5'-phosphate synthase n=1 Tax=Lwoffella lincolnii TaxID=90241 RepID=A0A1T0CDF2_9GAMM|nr:pyridoxine 5'-phosphate synthase [Moraxella lincolnii]OOS20309.1 pyridoxine 5'-phosphate synthase [Moraxella lincolnii]
MNSPNLGVNIDHIATLRQARGVNYPDPVQGALICEQAGADGITLHLREDRRHIQDDDVKRIKDAISIAMNLEMAATDEMLIIAKQIQPDWVCLVPEKRAELTTEGGLNVVGQLQYLHGYVANLQAVGCQVSLFIDADIAQIDAAATIGANAIEIHTGAYAEAGLAGNQHLQTAELTRIINAVNHSRQIAPNMLVNAGHGLTRDNVTAIAQIDGINELNIGHALIADAVFMGLSQAVQAMKKAMNNADNDEFG